MSLERDVQVRYQVIDNVRQDQIDSALAVLSDDELVRCERFRVERDRHAFAFAHALLRLTLSELVGESPQIWRFEIDPHGKPSLAAGGGRTAITFNLSHTRGIVACAVAQKACVGIDVESVSRVTDWRAIATHYFAVDEITELDALPEANRAARFFELWTLREALVKARGIGLTDRLDTAFLLDVTDAIDWSPPAELEPATWGMALFSPTPEHRLAVAVSDGSAAPWTIVARSTHECRPLLPTRRLSSQSV